MKKLLLVTLFGIAVLGVSSPARAGTIYVTENEMGPYGTNTYSGGTLGWSSFFSGYNGQMNLTANAGSSPGLPIFNVPVWWIDQPGFIGLGKNPSVDGTPIVYTIEPLSDFTTDFSGHSITAKQAGEIAALANIGDQTLRASPNNPNNAVFSNAVQAAISDIEYGSTSDGGAAVNVETAKLLTFAQSLTPSQLASYHAEILVDAKDQKLITSIPEPDTLSLFGIGLAGLVLLSHAFRKLYVAPWWGVAEA